MGKKESREENERKECRHAGAELFQAQDKFI